MCIRDSYKTGAIFKFFYYVKYLSIDTLFFDPGISVFDADIFGYIGFLTYSIRGILVSILQKKITILYYEFRFFGIDHRIEDMLVFDFLVSITGSKTCW